MVDGLGDSCDPYINKPITKPIYEIMTPNIEFYMGMEVYGGHTKERLRTMVPYLSPHEQLMTMIDNSHRIHKSAEMGRTIDCSLAKNTVFICLVVAFRCG